MNKTLYFFYAFLSICLLNACGQERVFEKNYDLPEAKWAADSILVFELDIKDAKAKYNFYYNLRNDLMYPYQNIYVSFYLENEKQEIIAQELQNITLFDVKTGQPFGSGFGSVYSHQLAIPKLTNFKFPTAGKYTYKLEQRMREDLLPKVLSVGLKIEKAL